MANLERMPTLAKMAPKARTDKSSSALFHQRNHASSAHQEFKAQSVNQDQRDLSDQKESPQTRPTMERRENRVCQDRKAFQDQLDLQEPLDQRDNPDELSKSTGLPDPPESVDLPALLVRREPREEMETKAQPERLALSETKERSVHKETQANPDRLEPRAVPEKRALATTARHHVLHQVIKNLIGMVPLFNLYHSSIHLCLFYINPYSNS